MKVFVAALKFLGHAVLINDIVLYLCVSFIFSIFTTSFFVCHTCACMYGGLSLCVCI